MNNKEINSKTKMIGILTWFNSGMNYGQTLQAYALYNVLKKMGYDVQVLSYGPGIFNRSKIVNRVINSYYNRKKMGLFKQFNRFIADNLQTSRPLKNKSDICKYLKKLGFDAIICGSDQIWNPFSFDSVFFLDIDVPINKIAYAPSVVDIKWKREFDAHPEVKGYLSNLTSISVREKSGAQIVEELCGIHPEVVLDPTLLLDNNEWNDLLYGETLLDKKYAFCYMFDLTDDQKSFISEDADRRKCEEVICLCPSEINLTNSDKVIKFIPVKDISIEKFLSIIKNAECVYTDSFHGMVFSIINHREFYVFDNGKNDDADKYYNFDRMITLLETLELLDRVWDIGYIKDKNEDIDYVKVDSILGKERNRSKSFLQDAIEKKPIKITEEKCVGCGACYNACPVGSIEIETDEMGFAYPMIKNVLCTGCGLCKTVCPQNKTTQQLTERRVKLIYDKNTERRCEATSGGVFGLLAEKILDAGGVVFGARYDQDYNVIIDYIEKREDIKLFKKSKYTQAVIGSSYTEAKRILDEGRKVLYSGTPCQIAGLKSFLKKEYINLYTVDIICHGVPSPVIYRKWLSTLEDKYSSKIESIDFRFKEVSEQDGEKRCSE